MIIMIPSYFFLAFPIHLKVGWEMTPAIGMSDMINAGV